MSIVLEDFDKCCRWCLTKSDKLESIFNSSLDDIFLTITSLKMERFDAHPQQACRWCITKLITAFNFYQMALRSHKTLTGILEKHQSTVQATSENQRTKEQRLVHQQIKDALLSTATDEPDDETALILGKISASITQTDGYSETTHALDEERYNTQDTYTWNEILDYNELSIQSNDHDYVMQSESQATVSMMKNKYYVEESDCLSDVEALATSIEVAQGKKCKICQNKFVDGNELKEHLLSHKVRCEGCYRTIYKQNIEKHVETHRDDLPKPFECNICQHRFQTKPRLHIHIRKVHGRKNRVFLCSYCGSSFKNESSLSRHLSIHTGKNLRICDVCNKKFLTRHSLIEHLKSHGREKPYPCESCNSGFTQMSSLRRHRRLQHAAGGQYKCAVCEALLDSREALRKHNRAIHGRHRCLKCKISFDDTSSLEVHNSEHHPNARKPSANSTQTLQRRKRADAGTVVAKALAMEYWCCGCGGVMPALGDLQEHSTNCIALTTQTPALQCKMCPTLFADSQTLLDHYSKTHEALSVNAPGGQRNVVILAAKLLLKDATST